MNPSRRICTKRDPLDPALVNRSKDGTIQFLSGPRLYDLKVFAEQEWADLPPSKRPELSEYFPSWVGYVRCAPRS
jgi:hypothetical protein